MSEITYYTILGIGRDATQSQIKTAHKKLVRKYHPDINKNPDAEAKMKAANAAYDVLRDTVKRAAYDRSVFSRAGAKTEAEKKAAAEAEERARREAEKTAAAEAEERARREAEKTAAAEAEERARREAEKKAAAEAEERARREAEKRAAAEAEERARREAEKRAAAEAEERARREAEKKAAAEAEERAGREEQQKIIEGVSHLKQRSIFTLDLKVFYIFVVSSKILAQNSSVDNKDNEIKRFSDASALLKSKLVKERSFQQSTHTQSFSIAVLFCITTLILWLVHHHNWSYASLVGTPIVWRISYLTISKIKEVYAAASTISATKKKSIKRSIYFTFLISSPFLIISINYSLLWLFLFIPLLIFVWEFAYKFLMRR